ncbi:MAG: ACT domain-containing protein [Clostridiales bacterium]|jgi:ACT domain-containing protein|nr:ACT domain-containing protein [Clostridiales bacterium]
MRAIVTVVGKDKVGIIARVSAYLKDIKANIEDISQTILQDYFVMIMLVDISKCDKKISSIQRDLDVIGAEIGVNARIQHEDIFNTMHKI